MDKMKKLIVAAILLLITVIGIYTIARDLSLFQANDKIDAFYPNEIIKRMNVMLAAALVWLAGKDALSKNDNTYMKLVFIVIIVGEVFFLLGKPFWAIISFMLCQLLLIKRHTKGLSGKLSKAPLPKTLVLLCLGVILLLLPRVAVILLPISKLPLPLLIVGTLYGMVLGASLWAGISNLSLGLFPHQNSIMIAFGMICFYLCDVLVGLDGLGLQGNAGLLVSSLIWLFYVPALTLLAMSCYSNSLHKNAFHSLDLKI